VEERRLFEAVERALAHRQGWERWLHKETGRLTGSLKQQLSELETILKQVDDGVLVLDRGGRLMMINRAVREAFGLDAREIVGLTPEEIFDNGELVAALSKDDSASSSHVEIETPDGRFYNLRQTYIPEIGTVASLHDISYLKELDRLKGDFVNTVSHDLRSPLTAILGYVELIERAGEVNKQQAEFIRRVKTSVHATTDLINDLLNLGRLEVGIVEDMHTLQLQDIVGGSVEAIMARVEQRGQTLRMAVDGKVSSVTGSPVQLRQVVDNLISNAVKYTPEGGEIRVMLREEDGQVILHVADNGPGIPTEDQGQIFDKFYRASNVSDEVQGTGLGLAIVKTVVDHHHGRIWVDSKSGKGSIFTVVLPVG
jgi:two-component system NtrC family sensor kinase